MLKPFYQGKLDTFCAIYAVLNALRLVHGIRTMKARDILNATLLDLASTPKYFDDVLTQNTDYIDLVDTMLQRQSSIVPLEVHKPFSSVALVDPRDFWDACRGWLGTSGENSGRAIIFRFLKYIKPDVAPINRHWTTADYVRDDILHLFDCSHEARAILNIPATSFVTDPAKVDSDHLLCIQPHSARFLRLPF